MRHPWSRPAPASWTCAPGDATMKAGVLGTVFLRSSGIHCVFATNTPLSQRSNVGAPPPAQTVGAAGCGNLSYDHFSPHGCTLIFFRGMNRLWNLLHNGLLQRGVIVRWLNEVRVAAPEPTRWRFRGPDGHIAGRIIGRIEVCANPNHTNLWP